MSNDNDCADPSQIGTWSDPDTETPRFYEQTEGDYLYEISHEEQAKKESQTLSSPNSQCSVFFVSTEAESSNQGELPLVFQVQVT
ncbi:MAG TPA: hypothetical protein VFH04_02710 [Nitrososphaeraceae archaeon]|nr:hypothetical protein [Nitrososphaeraceae archaeon]